jgi:hypothetical protein
LVGVLPEVVEPLEFVEPAELVEPVEPGCVEVDVDPDPDVAAVPEELASDPPQPLNIPVSATASTTARTVKVNISEP